MRHLALPIARDRAIVSPVAIDYDLTVGLRPPPNAAPTT